MAYIVMAHTGAMKTYSYGPHRCPDNTPEDFHTTMKTFVHTHGSHTVVPVFSIISNDLVVGWSDRYVDMCADMCVSMCVSLCVGMYVDMCGPRRRLQ